MSFHTPSDDLDFAVYGAANTNQLQLSPSQMLRLQHNKHQHSDEQDLTGYQSGLFDGSLGRRSLKDTSRQKKERTRASVVFADQTRVMASRPTLARNAFSIESGLNSHQRIDTSLATLQSRLPPLSPQQHHPRQQQPEHHLPPLHDKPKHHRQPHPIADTKTSRSVSSPSLVITMVDKVTDHPQDHFPPSSSHAYPGPTDHRHGHGHGHGVDDDADKTHHTGHTLDDDESAVQSLAVSRPRLGRTPTLLSTTSATGSGPPRLTQRLSYLAQLEDDDLDHEDDLDTKKDPSMDDSSAASTLPGSSSPPVSSTSSRQSSSYTARSSAHHRVAPEPSSRPHKSHPPQHHHQHNSKHPRQQSSSPQSSNVAPQIPKLYKRLLRMFKPPTESSDSDTGPVYHPEADIMNPQYARGPFGLPASPERTGVRRGSTPKKTSPMAESVKVMTPPNSANTSGASSSSKAPDSTGFRARFLKKLMSSPNLNGAPLAIPPTIITSRLSTPERPHTYKSAHEGCNEDDHQYQHLDGDQPVPPSPYSPLPSDFEHDTTCPAGQRIQARREGGRPRAATLPRLPPPMPTLQSKYGVPGRELGAGTQAQVMLLRVKSTKRLRASFPEVAKKTAAETAATIAPVTPPQQQRETLSAEDAYLDNDFVHGAVPLSPSALLTPHARSGTLMTTTEQEVTPEQREAYRKKLLRRTSTGAISIASTATGGERGGLIYAIKKFRPPRAAETHRQYLKKICAEFCISTSMDHENIIRTIDLVRDQPGQELIMDEGSKDEEDHHHHHQHDHHHHHGSSGGEDARDCSCPRPHSSHRRVRTIKSAGDLSSGSLSSPKQHKATIARRAVIAKPQRKRSVDSLSHMSNSRRGSSSGGNTGHGNQVHPRPGPSVITGPRGQPSPSSSSAMVRSYGDHQLNSAIKRRKQAEQEQRQREVARLKQQKQREKDQAKQLRLDQFPEYCMVMEYAGGGDLFNLLTKTQPPISLAEKHCLWRQLLNGVQYMHSMGVAHRDLKPENILIDGTGRILKITDFGIANVFKSVGDPSPLPCRGIIGSEPYIAPEEFYQEEYDPRAVDVWACGIIFYVMFYAAMPWARADRKKDARYARFFNDIMTYRQSEPQRRLQHERRQIHAAAKQHHHHHSQPQPHAHHHHHHHSHQHQHQQHHSEPHLVSHHRQFPPYNVNDMVHQGSTSSSSSSTAGSPTSPESRSQDGHVTDSPHSSVQSSPVHGPQDPTSCPTLSLSSAITSPPPVPVPVAIYNTFSYNNHLGGHEFLDKIEAVGCRRILYAILEPEAKKRLTIDQVLRDSWVNRVRFCTDDVRRQEIQAEMVHGPGAKAEDYLVLEEGDVDVSGVNEDGVKKSRRGQRQHQYQYHNHGEHQRKLHHYHAVPKKTKT